MSGITADSSLPLREGLGGGGDTGEISPASPPQPDPPPQGGSGVAEETPFRRFVSQFAESRLAVSSAGVRTRRRGVNGPGCARRSSPSTAMEYKMGTICAG